MQLTMRDAARMLNLSERDVQNRIRQGEIPARRVNGRYHLNRAELVEWATTHNMPVSAGLLSAESVPPEPFPDLASALQIGGIVHDLPGADKSTVLRNMVHAMPLPPDTDPDFLCDILLAREALGSTAIGEGIAVPHPRNPIVLRVAQPMVTLGFLSNPIEFGALDGKPVHILFSLISPTTRAHLHLLSRLGFALRDPAFRRGVIAHLPSEEIMREVRRIETALAPGALPGKSDSC